MKQTLTILLCLPLFLAACQQDESYSAQSAQGHIMLSLSADDALQTRAQQDVEDPSAWIATITTEGSTLYDQPIGNGLAAQSFDPGIYSIAVRNYADADAANAALEGWGAAYHTGQATDVEVSAGGTAYVHIACGRAQNAKFRLDYSTFSGIINSLTVTAPKTITFSYADGTLSREAFFAPNAALTYAIDYTIDGNTKTTEPMTLTLGGAATVTTLSIKSNISGELSISLTCDDEFEGDAESDIIIDATTGKS